MVALPAAGVRGRVVHHAARDYGGSCRGISARFARPGKGFFCGPMPKGFVFHPSLRWVLIVVYT